MRIPHSLNAKVLVANVMQGQSWMRYSEYFFPIKNTDFIIDEIIFVLFSMNNNDFITDLGLT